MKGNQQNQSKRKPAQPARYTVHTAGPRGTEQIGSGIDLDEEIVFAQRFHEATNQQVWIWNLNDGGTVFQIGDKARSAGGSR